MTCIHSYCRAILIQSRAKSANQITAEQKEEKGSNALQRKSLFKTDTGDSKNVVKTKGAQRHSEIKSEENTLLLRKLIVV